MPSLANSNLRHQSRRRWSIPQGRHAFAFLNHCTINHKISRLRDRRITSVDWELRSSRSNLLFTALRHLQMHNDRNLLASSRGRRQTFTIASRRFPVTLDWESSNSRLNSTSMHSIRLPSARQNGYPCCTLGYSGATGAFLYLVKGQ